jgi:hypothetical protein
MIALQSATHCPIRIATACTLLLICVGSTGCQSVIDSTNTTRRQLTRQFTPSPHDYRDSTAETEDKWLEYTREAKATHPAEKDPDPWYRRWFMSEKARQTESHLGID